MKLFKNAAMITPPEPQHVTHHHHAPSYVGPVLVVAVVVLGGLWGLQRWIISLFDRLHFNDPEATFSLLFLGLLVGVPLLWLINRTLHGWAEARHGRRLELEQLALDRLELQHRLQRSVVQDTRTHDPAEARRVGLIIQVMTDAYDHILKNGSYTGKDKRPWARRNAGQYVLTGEQDPVGQGSVLIGDAMTWLKDNKVLVGKTKYEQVNLSQYPNLAAVQRKLYKPVLIGQFDKIA